MKIIITNIDSNTRNVFFGIGKYLLSKNCDVIFVTVSNVFEKHAKSEGFKVINSEQATRKLIRDKGIARTYDRSFLKAIYEADINLWGKKDKYLETKTLAYFEFWNSLMDLEKPDIIVNLDGGELLVNTSYHVAKEKKVLWLTAPGLAYFPNTMFWSKTTMTNDWVKPLRKSKFPAELKHSVVEHITKLVSEKPVHGGKPRNKIVTFQNVRKILGFVYKYVFIEKFGDYHNPVLPVKYRAKQILRKYLSKKYYREFDPNAKYVFMPLHVPEDAQITIRAKKYAEQDKIVAAVAKALPEGYLLYTKGHPHAVGGFSLRWLKNISKITNVRLLDPSVNSHDIIQNSACVVVINSTVGWEAILYKKPIVVLAKPFYANKGLTYDVDALDELEGKIRLALSAKPLSDKKALDFACAVRSSLYDCCFYKFRNGYRYFNDDLENVKRIGESILTELELNNG